MTFMNKNGIMPEVVPLLGMHLHKYRAGVVRQKAKLSLIYMKSMSSAEPNLEETFKDYIHIQNIVKYCKHQEYRRNFNVIDSDIK